MMCLESIAVLMLKIVAKRRLWRKTCALMKNFHWLKWRPCHVKDFSGKGLSYKSEPVWYSSKTMSYNVSKGLFKDKFKFLSLPTYSFTSIQRILHQHSFSPWYSTNINFYQITKKWESFTFTTVKRIIIRQFFFQWHNEFSIVCCSTRHTFENYLEFVLELFHYITFEGHK